MTRVIATAGQMLSQLGFKHLAVAERIQSSGAKIERARDLTAAGQISSALTDLSNQQQ